MLTQSKNQSDRRITSCVFHVDYFPRALKTCSNVKESHYYVYIVILFRQRNEKPNDVSAVTIEDKTLSSCRAGRSSCWTQLAWQKSIRKMAMHALSLNGCRAEFFFLPSLLMTVNRRCASSRCISCFWFWSSDRVSCIHIYRISERANIPLPFYFFLSAQKNVPGRATKLATFHVLSSLSLNSCLSSCFVSIVRRVFTTLPYA